ncbi:hypothetical protein PIB30_028410 [Stylosanthes scabra]|uniref:Protein DEFECTIVE IN MERISTEM SILENCING 3-like n=1 Tax=Stylosanthes scabra TaxID=79078 RepID=A0ABU6V9V8_9FABA|nr:hypothetical protein [Stylosanthes scabra]
MQNPYHTNPVSIQGSSALVPVDLNENGVDSHNDVKNDGYQQILEADLHSFGMKIKQHEDNVNNLNAQKSKMEDSILQLQVTIGKSESSGTFTIDNGDSPLSISEEEVNKLIMQHEKSAASILCQIKTRYKAQASHVSPIKDVVGIVATLGQVEDDNLSRLFSEYLGLDTMLALVCRTIEGVKALEMHDKDGSVDKSFGLHGLGASIGRALDGRFQVICLESLRPYAGTFMADDAQRKLDILNPRLPNGACPAGFLGFAVNMINIDSSNLFCVAPNGCGLRETLFYNLFSRTQVYKTRADMAQALPFICDGAISLDGGIIKSCGVYYLGNREDVDVRFPRPARSMGIDNSLKLEMQLKDLKSQKENILEDLKREQTMLDVAKYNFQKKKNEYIRFLAESSANATQVQTTPDRLRRRS